MSLIRNPLNLLALCALLALPLNAAADSEGLFIGGGVYYAELDEDFGRGDIDIDEIEDARDAIVFFDDKSVGFNGAVGWRFNKWIAIDAGYWDLGEFKSDDVEDLGIDKVKVDTTAWTVGAMVSVPLWILDVYARGGAAMWDADSRYLEDDGTDPYYGVGAALNIFGSLDIYAEWVRFDLDTSVDSIGLGLRYTF